MKAKKNDKRKDERKEKNNNPVYYFGACVISPFKYTHFDRTLSRR